MLALLLTLLLAAPRPPADPPPARQGVYAVTGARLVTVTDGVIEQGTLVIRADTIAALGADVAVPDDAYVIDGTGLSVYPGLIDAGTTLGLVEIGSLSETRDFDEIGELTPQIDALTAVNPNSVLIPVTRLSGVTTVLTEPSGSLLPGQAALINLHGYTPAQMHLGGYEAVRLEYPATGRHGRWDRRTDEEIEKQAEEALARLDEVWEQATLYARIDSAYRADPDAERRPDYVPAMQALVPVVRGEKPLLVRVDAAADIRSALDWLDRHGVRRAVLSGVAEGWRVADRIAEAGVPVLAGPVLAVPSRASDRYDKPYRNAALMHEAGVIVALRTGEAENVRNLPFHAGFAAAYGLGRDEALRAVTITPAHIFGVDHLVGSLEVGKRATLFLADGDPFEPRTDVRHVFIDGYIIPMESRQTRLYHEFDHRRPGLTTEPTGGRP